MSVPSLPWLADFARGDWAGGLVRLRAALGDTPDHPEARRHLGLALEATGDPAGAEACFRALLAERPGDADLLVDLGSVLAAAGRDDEAASCFDTALAVVPDHLRANGAKPLLALRRGDFAEGWQRFEVRWRTPYYRAIDRGFPHPPWRGPEPLAGRTLFLHAEHAFGDTIQFCRYARLAADAGARVVLEVQPALAELLAGLDPRVRVMARGCPLPAFDLHCPLLSLPRAFGTTVATIPAEPAYLAAEPARIVRMRRLVPALERAGLKVGVAWAGNPYPGDPAAQLVDRRRSIAPAALAPLGEIPGVTLVSLQAGPAAGAPDRPGGEALVDPMGAVRDFADTAAVVAGLDLVVTVDTAVAHLAGALGRPVWLLDRFDHCWRWLRGRTDSPWYPQLTIFRQPRPGDWTVPIAQAAAALAAFSNPCPPGPAMR